MGISGLLPLLKSISVNKHLSDLEGQRLAVDAYVWLHRGVYACATEVATGKKTTKYVDYAMTRIRLLRHFKIQPYIVFDGGPLPAKRGTESDRKSRREENLAEANRLAAQGKHSQAREYYVKCVDVTPEMAFQFIKALRAESVPYVVAPYEADAQLAYLERTNLVDGIITEDSDLLVFGCRNVFFKLDTVGYTVTSISRADFGSVSAAEGGISLVGWSDVQFRAMAILSGCDYLGSIPGVGLKTAWSLLRKHKTVEKVIRALKFEGKKKVPNNYIKSFKLVEKVFLHQRVYDPVTERLVYLTDLPVGEKLTVEEEVFIGEELDPLLAKKLALGDVCPITLLPMVDVNPGFMPRALKNLPLVVNTADRKQPDMEASKAKNKSILSFFATQNVTSTQRNQSPKSGAEVLAGKASGKRRLSDMSECETPPKVPTDENRRPSKRPLIAHSKYFGASPQPLPTPGPSTGPSRSSHSEQVSFLDLEQVDPCKGTEVSQEDGYLSPSPFSTRSATPDLSSPIQPPRALSIYLGVGDDDFGAETLSSPVARRDKNISYPKEVSKPTILVRSSVERDIDCIDIDTEDEGPDLRTNFGDELTSDIDPAEPERSFISNTSSSGSGPFTPTDSREVPLDKRPVSGLDEDVDEIVEPPMHNLRTNNVVDGWAQQWAYGRTKLAQTHLKRAETTTTDGRRRLQSLHNTHATRHSVVSPNLFRAVKNQKPAAPGSALAEFVETESATSRLAVFRFRGR